MLSMVVSLDMLALTHSKIMQAYLEIVVVIGGVPVIVVVRVVVEF